MLAQLKELFHSVFQSVNEIDKQFQKMGLPNDVVAFYNSKKVALYRKFLFDALSKTLDCNFLAKAQLILDNRGYVGEPAQLDSLLEFLAEEVLLRDVVGVFDQLALREQQRLVSKEYLDFRNSRFPPIRDEINLKTELASQADAFAAVIRNYSAMVASTFEQLIAGTHTALTPNPDTIPLVLLDRLIGSQNNKIGAKLPSKIFKKGAVPGHLPAQRLQNQGQPEVHRRSHPRRVQ